MSTAYLDGWAAASKHMWSGEVKTITRDQMVERHGTEWTDGFVDHWLKLTGQTVS